MRRDCGDRDTILDQKAWCKVCHVDYKENKEKIRELNALIIALGKKSLGEYAEDKPVWKAIKLATKELSEDSFYWASIHDLTLSKDIEARKKEQSLLQLFSYLLLVEGYYSKIVRILSIMLIENGYDLLDPLRNEFITNFEELDRVSLSIKLKFLKKHGFGFFVDSIDKGLRNDIAHLNVQVTDDGKILNRREKGKQSKDVENKILSLSWMCTLVGSVLDCTFLRGKHPDYGDTYG